MLKYLKPQKLKTSKQYLKTVTGKVKATDIMRYIIQ